MREFLSMGGYGFYVWSAYGVAAVVMLGLLRSSLTWHRRLTGQLRNKSRRAASAPPAALDKTGGDWT
ncbi:MAG: heme exporter protein CcmD [Gammaproteobacteria bacterium]